MEVREEFGERLLRLGVHTCRRFVEHEQRRLSGQRLRDESPLLHSARERAHRHLRDGGQSDALDRLGDEPRILPARAPDDPSTGDTARGHDLADRGRRVTAGRRALGEVSERAPSRVPVRRLAEEKCRAGRRPLEAEQDADERRLAAAVGTRYGDELSLSQAEIHVLEHVLARPIAERDALELDR